MATLEQARTHFEAGQFGQGPRRGAGGLGRDARRRRAAARSRPRRRRDGRRRRRRAAREGHGAPARLGRGVARPRRRAGGRGPDGRGGRRVPQGARDRARRRGGDHGARARRVPGGRQERGRDDARAGGRPRLDDDRGDLARRHVPHARPGRGGARRRRSAWRPPTRRSRSTRSTWPSSRSRRATPTRPLEAFGRLRQIVDLPEHEVAALQGLVKAELARDRAQEALELARQASAIDTVGRSTGVLAHLEADLGVDSSPEDAVARGQSTAFLQAHPGAALAPGGDRADRRDAGRPAAQPGR